LINQSINQSINVLINQSINPFIVNNNRPSYFNCNDVWRRYIKLWKKNPDVSTMKA